MIKLLDFRLMMFGEYFAHPNPAFLMKFQVLKTRHITRHMVSRIDRLSYEDLMKRAQPPRERAARALCWFNGLPQDTLFEGHPMWESFLPEVDVVLEAALGTDEAERMKRDDATL